MPECLPAPAAYWARAGGCGAACPSPAASLVAGGLRGSGGGRVLQELGDGGHSAAAGELLAEVLQGVGAASGGDTSHSVDGDVGGLDGGIDVAEVEVGFGEPGLVDGVAARERGGVVGLVAVDG